jgi:acetyltransferase-like isoleucine patch superfamily enzyme
MSFSTLKLKLILSQSCFWRTWARLRGAEVAKDAVIIGKLQIRVAKGARLVIDSKVKLCSSPAINPLVSRTRCTLWAMAPGAILKLGPGVGCSSICICAARNIRIGEGTIFGADCLVVDNDFHLPGASWSWLDRPSETAKPVSIGRGCFIGARSIILKGVTIGDGCVIGAGSLVSCDVPDGHLAAGNPVMVRPLQGRWLRVNPAPEACKT